MKVFKFTPEGIENCSVIAWIHTDLGTGVEPIKYPAIIICPGGGYARVTTREAEPVANPYFAAWYNTFILNYSVGEKAKDFYPLCQLASAVAHIRRHAEELNTVADRITVCGFSAGGHLAASLGTLYDAPEFLERFGRADYIRPDALILAYSCAKVPFEYHVFPKGGHGMSVCTEEVGTPSEYNARWVKWSIKWLKQMFVKESKAE